MNLKNTATAALSSAFLFLSACSDDSSSSSASFDIPANQRELIINHNLLQALYIYAQIGKDEISEDINTYLGKGTEKDIQNKRGETVCSEEYYDVCYMYNQMKDPFTRYYDPSIAPKAFKRLTESVEMVSIKGATLIPTDNTGEIGKVVSLTEDAMKGGLQIGDIIYPSALDSVYDSSKDGETYTITVSRDKEEVEVKVTLTNEKQPTVKLFYEVAESGDTIPVIRITEFDMNTVGEGGTREEFAEALEKTKGAKATIIDLRNNGGGDTEHCNATSAEFLSKGDTITIDMEQNIYLGINNTTMDTVYFAQLDTTTTVAEKDGSAKDRYVVLMANGGSASCAELMISALAVNKKTPIVGELTYGKQIGQIFITSLNGNEFIPDMTPDGLAVITELYAIDKNGDTYQDVGIVPDYEIEDFDEQMKKAVELAAEGTAVRTAGYGTEKLGHFLKAREEIKDYTSIKDMKIRYKILK